MPTRRWFLSYNSKDEKLAEALLATLKNKDPTANVFYAKRSLRAGGYWLPVLGQEIADATGFILLVGESGISDWQTLEYYDALDKRVKTPHFQIVFVLLQGQTAPGLPFLKQLHWVSTPDPGSEQTIAQILHGAAGDASQPRQLWRFTAPYRGLVDLGRIDGEGFLRVLGRRGDVIVTNGGQRIFPSEIEMLLREHPAVAEAAVAGQPHPAAGETIAAWVVLREDAVATAVELAAYCAEALTKEKRPREIFVCEALPRNANGKVIKARLRDACAIG
jgi:acyl-CoA synthetase (AMP-forming)/AMP-acid ligase II